MDELSTKDEIMNMLSAIVVGGLCAVPLLLLVGNVFGVGRDRG